jgi:DNA-binding NarL/FixJ family response regulator
MRGVTNARDEVAVLVVDDHRVFTDALRIGMGVHEGVRCAAVAHSAHEALARAAAVAFDVALVDLDLPDADGLVLVGRLRERHPEVRAIVLTAFARPDLADRALAAGAVGFLGKDGTLERILTAVRTADAAHPVLDPAVERARGEHVALTPREHDVLRGLAAGHDVGRIAQELGISRFTTRDHVKAVLGKLGAHSQLAAVVAAQRLGLVRLGSRR